MQRPRLADICKKFYASYYELDNQTQNKLATYLREIQAHINHTSVRDQTYSVLITGLEISQYENIVNVLRVLCPLIVSTTSETLSKQKLKFTICWKGTFTVPNQFCNSINNLSCANNITEPYVVRLRGKMSEWQTVEVPSKPDTWVGRLRTSSKDTQIVNECDLVQENNELKKKIKQLEDKLLQIFAD
jgi:hypothetical protein